MLEEGKEGLLIDPRELGPAQAAAAGERDGGERSRGRSCGIEAYSADAELRSVVFALDGQMWLVGTGAGAPRPVATPGPVVDPRLDPTGKRVAYASNRALHVVEVTDGAPCLSIEPDAADVSYGVPDPVSLYGGRGHWWAPDGGALLVTRVDTTAVSRVWIADPTHPSKAPRKIAYPTAGGANADVSLHIFTISGSPREVVWDRKAFEYLLTADWDAHGPLISVQSRDQCRLQILAADADTGSTRVLQEDTDPVWVQPTPGAPLRTAAGRLVHTSDLGGARRLVIDGTPVTPAELQVREVLGAISESVLFVASQDPTELHVWCYEQTSGVRPLTDKPGVHRAHGAGATVVITSHSEAGHVITVSNPARPDAAIASCEAEPVVSLNIAWLSIGGREIRTALLLPSWYSPGHKLPVLMSPYGGAASQRVTRARHWWFCEAQWFAEHGFAVIIADGSGTPGRGPGWEKEVHGDSLSSVIADQVAALIGTADRCTDLDLTRVAIRGSSFGGTLAAAAVLRRPDVFHCAISQAAPSDMRLYYTHFRERFLGKPQDNPEGYRRGSTLNEAGALSRPLLLIHGLADETVLVAHSLRMSAALFAAGRAHELLLLPGAGHRVTDETQVAELLLRQLAFLAKTLELRALQLDETSSA